MTQQRFLATLVLVGVVAFGSACGESPAPLRAGAGAGAGEPSTTTAAPPDAAAIDLTSPTTPPADAPAAPLGSPPAPDDPHPDAVMDPNHGHALEASTDACSETSGTPLAPSPDWARTWETEPQINDALVIRLCVDDVTPDVGQPVVVTVEVSDPDAVVVDDGCGIQVRWGDEGPMMGFCRDYLAVGLAPVPTPAEEPGHWVATFTHEYTEPGVNAVRALGMSGDYRGYELPYDSSASVEMTLLVGAAHLEGPVCVEATGESRAPRDDWDDSWQTEPEIDDPLTLRLCIGDVTPTIGQVVTATVEASDPDAVVVEHECGVHLTWGDGEFGVRDNMCRDFFRVGSGPMPTPPEEPGHRMVTFTHTFGASGSSIVQAMGWSGDYHGVSLPYSSLTYIDLPVVVGP